MILVLTVCLVCLPSLVLCTQDDLSETYQTSLATSLADFTQAIYVHLATTSSEDNFVFSPPVLHSSLCVLYLAAKQHSPTQTELGAAMGKVTSGDLVKSAYRNLIRSYR